MFAPDVPSYRIDLRRPPAQRWAEVIAADREDARRLAEEAGAEFAHVPNVARWAFDRLYRAFGGLYRGELEAWAAGLGLSLGTVTMLNCAYELSHLRWPRLFGCTAGVRLVEGLGLVHVRNLDWPLATMGAATRLFRFLDGSREFVTVGVPGQVGVLSGMVPGGYSATINWAPPAAFPTFEFGPAFLLRDTLEKCDRYDDAVRRLEQTVLSTSVFFTVCGTEPGEACVIERTARAAVVRPLEGVVVQANHHVAPRFAANNADLDDAAEGEEEFTREGSCSRMDALARALAETPAPCSLGEAARVLDVPRVLNSLTCQQMVFCPRAGQVLAWRRAG